MHNSIATGARCQHAHRANARTSPRRTAQPGRLAVSALVVATVLVSLASLLARPEAPAPDTWTTVSVASYVTLWDLARIHGVDGLDTAATIDLIREENRLRSSTLQEGQTLRVPASASGMTALAQR